MPNVQSILNIILAHQVYKRINTLTSLNDF